MPELYLNEATQIGNFDLKVDRTDVTNCDSLDFFIFFLIPFFNECTPDIASQYFRSKFPV